MKNFRINWILEKRQKQTRIYLPKNSLNALPSVGDELRADEKRFFKVLRIVWCFDEDDELGQRINIGIKAVD